MNEKDVKKIRKAVEGQEEEKVTPYENEEKPSKPKIPPKKIEIPERKEKSKEPERKETSEPTIKTGKGMRDSEMAQVKTPTPGSSDFAPLFVKVEKYRETVLGLQEIKTYLSGVREIFEVVKDLEELRKISVDMVLSSIEKLETTVADLDQMLLKPPGIRLEGYAEGMEDVEKIELSMIELHKEIEELRDRLAKLKAK